MITLPEVESEENLVSPIGRRYIVAAVSDLEIAATTHDPSLDLANYHSLSIDWKEDRRTYRNTCRASVLRELGNGSIRLIYSSIYREGDQYWSESKAELLLGPDDKPSYAVSDSRTHRPNYVSPFDYHGDEVAETTHGHLVWIDPKTILKVRISLPVPA